MKEQPAKLGQTPVMLRRAQKCAMYGNRAVLTTSVWEYVELWLERKKCSTEAWKQARAFYELLGSLPVPAQPLLAYYFALNAAKTLLEVKSVTASQEHGASGAHSSSAWLANERVTIRGNGVLGGLGRYLGSHLNSPMVLTLKDIFGALPHIHRPYVTTFNSERECFIPISEPQFMARDGHCWVEFHLRGAYWTSGKSLRLMPDGFEPASVVDGKEEFSFRRKKNFNWPGTRVDRIASLRQEHDKVRSQFRCISRAKPYWYLPTRTLKCTLPPLVLMYAGLHRLSELARYSPDRLGDLLRTKQNWLICEFIRDTPRQFLSQVSVEITGERLISVA